MKKVFILAIAMICLSAFSAAADSYTYNQGYRGNVGFGVVNESGENMFAGLANLETNHGYSFGNGLYAGGGIGFYVHSDSKNAVVPIYAEGKYNFPNFLVSPFVDARVGVTSFVNTETKKAIGAFMVSPSVGVDIWRFSLSWFYQWNFSAKLNKAGNIQCTGITLHFNW